MEYNTYYRYYKVTTELRPSEIMFTQDSVAMCFKDGHDLNETCKDIAVGNLQVNQLPKIRVILRNGIYYSSDNRRLYIFRVLERLGFLKKIYVFKVKQTNRDITTENGGCHIKIRNRPDTSGGWTQWKLATTYRHCPCPYAWKEREIPDWWFGNRFLQCRTQTIHLESASNSHNQHRFDHTHYQKRYTTEVERSHLRIAHRASTSRSRESSECGSLLMLMFFIFVIFLVLMSQQPKGR